MTQDIQPVNQNLI